MSRVPAERMNMALRTLGSAYGYVIIHPTPSLPPIGEPGPKMPGNEVIGSARKPPSIGPITTPDGSQYDAEASRFAELTNVEAHGQEQKCP